MKGSARTIRMVEAQHSRNGEKGLSDNQQRYGLHRVRRGPAFASDGLSDLMADLMYETLTKRGGPPRKCQLSLPCRYRQMSVAQSSALEISAKRFGGNPCASPPDRRGQLGRRRMTPAGVRLAGGVAKPGSVHCRNPRAARWRGGRLRYARPAPLGRRSRREWSCAEIQR